MSTFTISYSQRFIENFRWLNAQSTKLCIAALIIGMRRKGMILGKIGKLALFVITILISYGLFLLITSEWSTPSKKFSFYLKFSIIRITNIPGSYSLVAEVGPIGFQNLLTLSYWNIWLTAFAHFPHLAEVFSLFLRFLCKPITGANALIRLMKMYFLLDNT